VNSIFSILFYSIIYGDEDSTMFLDEFLMIAGLKMILKNKIVL